MRHQFFLGAASYLRHDDKKPFPDLSRDVVAEPFQDVDPRPDSLLKGAVFRFLKEHLPYTLAVQKKISGVR